MSQEKYWIRKEINILNIVISKSDEPPDCGSDLCRTSSFPANIRFLIVFGASLRPSFQPSLLSAQKVEESLLVNR